MYVKLVRSKWSRLPVKRIRLNLLSGLLLMGSASLVFAECSDQNTNKRAYYGDLHIHTGLSADAMLFGTNNRPDDAYRFARGGVIPLKPVAGGIPPVDARLDRPLDFAAITDHAENIGSISMCTRPDSKAYDTQSCKFVRAPLPTSSMEVFATRVTKALNMLFTSEEICGPDRNACRDAVQYPWKEIQGAAADWNAPCEFTSFVGYEYSANFEGSKVHHNVIFRNEKVPEAPISAGDVPSMIDLWRKLKTDCKESGTGCDVLAIPHNSNLSNGRMFRLDYEGETDPVKQREIAKLRAEMEPVVEMFQQKGDSECRNGLWNVLGGSDEWCEFDKYRDWQGGKFEDCEGELGAGALLGRGCISRLDYTRYALAAGLAENRRIGVNPHMFGVIGSTDAHDGSAADVDEWVHDGKQRKENPIGIGRMSTGGLAGIWAEENTRESLFGSMRKREVFATTGTRIQARFFAAEKFDQNLCEDPSFVSKAYKNGVPMGSELELRKGQSPSFLVSALADIGSERHAGTPLQRLQIIKAWAGEGDQLHQQVFDIADASSPNTPASVNLSSCERQGTGAASMCSVWKDPDYDEAVAAVYYARVIENPSCRHTGYLCANYEGGELPDFCADTSVPKQMQERAWTSPIWVSSKSESK
jgi:hypothetical protein